MFKSIAILFIATCTLITPLVAYSDDDPTATCTSAAALFKEGDLDGALEEARWCVTQLEQLKQGKISTFFKDEINGFKGGKLNQQKAMGFSMVERSYSKDGKVIKVSLSGGTSGAASNAFAALASMGMSAGAGTKVRIQRRTAVLNATNGNNQLGVTLKNGGLLNFESRDIPAEEIVSFAKAFPVADLDDALK